jgi:hypothetical protein
VGASEPREEHRGRTLEADGEAGNGAAGSSTRSRSRRWRGRRITRIPIGGYTVTAGFEPSWRHVQRYRATRPSCLTGQVAARWDGDQTGRGVGSAVQLLTGASELIAAFGQPDWVAEQPELHLLPHVEAWCRQDRRLALTGTHTDDSRAYVLDLEWRSTTGSVGAVRAAVFSLIGSFAESATYVRQRHVVSDDSGPATELQFEVGTGELGPGVRFLPHGHVVLINVVGIM